MSESKAPGRALDLNFIRERLEQGESRYWRSLEEAAGEKAAPAPAPPNLSRRAFLGLMGASLALAAGAGCGRQPTEPIVPYVRQPEQQTPGIPLYYATALCLGGIATGVLVKSREGRPVKVEGNPDHPASLGASDVFMQAQLLQMYDPDRSQAVRNLAEPSTWQRFLTALTGALERRPGTGLRILTETVTSPTMAAQIAVLERRFPGAVWHAYEPVNRDNVRAGARLELGADVEPIYHLDRADVILSLDSDFLQSMPGSLRYARDFAGRRRVRQGSAHMNRLYAVESAPTITGAAADHRLALPPSHIATFAHALAEMLTTANGPQTTESEVASGPSSVVRSLNT